MWSRRGRRRFGHVAGREYGFEVGRSAESRVAAPAFTLGYGPRYPTRAWTGVLIGVAVGGFVALLLNLPPKLILTGIAAVLLPSAAILSRSPTRVIWFLLVLSIPIHVDLEVMSHPEHYTGARSFYLDAVTLLAASLACVAALRVLARRDRIEFIPSPIWVALAIYLLLAAATIPASAAPLLGSMEVLRMSEEFLLVLVVSHLVRTRRDVVFLVIAMLGIAFGETLLAMVQFGSGRFVNLSFIGGAVSTLTEEFGRGEYHRVAGTFLHPALFGSYLVVHLSLAMALLFAVRRGAARLALGTVFLLCFVSLILTFSRIEWAGFAAAATAVVVMAARARLLTRREFAWLIGIAALLVGVTLLFSGLIVGRIFQSNPANLAERVNSYREAWQLFTAHPLRGVGLNNYMEAIAGFPGAGADPIPVHNFFLLVLAETGMPGLLAFVGLLVAIAWEGRRCLSVPDPLVRAIAIGLLGGMVAFLVDFFSTFTLRFSAMSTLFWFAVGLLVAIRASGRHWEASV